MADQPAVYATCDPTATIAALKAVEPAVQKRTDAVSEDTADRVAGDARSRVARRTGATAASIHVAKNPQSDGYLVIVGGAGLYLEFGTRYMAARAFLVPSLLMEKPGFDRRMQDATQSGIDVTGLGPV